jgi:hypothetical protein
MKKPEKDIRNNYVVLTILSECLGERESEAGLGWPRRLQQLRGPMLFLISDVLVYAPHKNLDGM